MITIQPTINGGATATYGSDATVTLVDEYNGGSCIDGSHYVIAPAALKFSTSSPAPATVDGRAGHGIQANLEQGGPNALDGGVAEYSAGATLSTSTALPVGSAIVKVRASDPMENAGRAGLFEGAATVIHVVASAPAYRAMAPVVWPSASLASKPWRVADIDGMLASLPSYATTGAPTWASIASYYDKLDFALAWYQGIRYQYLTPRRINNTTSAYGRWRGQVEGTVWAGLCSNAWSAAEKTAALIRQLSNGCQIAEAYGATANIIGEDGGQFQFGLANALAWLKATGREGQYAATMPKIGGGPRGQYYQVTAGMFDRHTSAVLPYIARERTVVSITGSGPYVVTVTDYAGEPGANAGFHGGNLCRVVGGVDGAEALIDATGTPDGSGDYPLTMAALPTGLTVSDTVYVKQVTPLSVGTYDYVMEGNSPMHNNPLESSGYRSGQNHGNQIAPISVLGMRGSDLTPAMDYMLRRTAAQNYGGGGWTETFWATHQATALAVTQIV